MSTADLRELAAEIERAGHEAHAAGDLEWALRCLTWALRLGKELDPAEAKRLTAGKYLPKLRPMDDAQKEAISRGRTNSPMMRHARISGFQTLAALAEALKKAGYPEKGPPVGISFLSQVSSKNKPMPPDLAKALTKVIGWP